MVFIETGLTYIEKRIEIILMGIGALLGIGAALGIYTYLKERRYGIELYEFSCDFLGILLSILLYVAYLAVGLVILYIIGVGFTHGEPFCMLFGPLALIVYGGFTYSYIIGDSE